MAQWGRPTLESVFAQISRPAALENNCLQIRLSNCHCPKGTPAHLSEYNLIPVLETEIARLWAGVRHPAQLDGISMKTCANRFAVNQPNTQHENRLVP